MKKQSQAEKCCWEINFSTFTVHNKSLFDLRCLIKMLPKFLKNRRIPANYTLKLVTHSRVTHHWTKKLSKSFGWILERIEAFVATRKIFVKMAHQSNKSRYSTNKNICKALRLRPSEPEEESPPSKKSWVENAFFCLAPSSPYQQNFVWKKLLVWIQVYN